jgi:hypothetical protein
MEGLLNDIPPFTKYWGAGLLLSGLLITTSIVHGSDLVFVPSLVFQRGEIWRIFTAPFFVGKLDLGLIIHAFFPLMLIRHFENRLYQNRLSLLIFMFILMAVFVLPLSSLFRSYMTGTSMLLAFEWVYSKMFSSGMVHFLMFIPLRLQWLPFAEMVIMLLQGGSIAPGVVGMIAGHTVFFLMYILPLEIGRPVLKTPRILARWLDTDVRNGAGERGRF